MHNQFAMEPAHHVYVTGVWRNPLKLASLLSNIDKKTHSMIHVLSKQDEAFSEARSALRILLESGLDFKTVLCIGSGRGSCQFVVITRNYEVLLASYSTGIPHTETEAHKTARLEEFDVILEGIRLRHDIDLVCVYGSLYHTAEACPRVPDCSILPSVVTTTMADFSPEWGFGRSLKDHKTIVMRHVRVRGDSHVQKVTFLPSLGNEPLFDLGSGKVALINVKTGEVLRSLNFNPALESIGLICTFISEP